MGLPTSYLTSLKNVTGILAAIKSAQAPKRFSTRFLVSLDFKSTTDRLVIGVLKSLGFLTIDSAAPTERYYQFLDQTQSEIVLAEGIKEAYSDLFQVNVEAHKMSKTQVVNKFKTLTQGQYSEGVLSNMGATFVALCKLADFETKRAKIPPEENEAPAEKPKENERDREKPEGEAEPEFTHGKSKSLGRLHYNIQLILPESRDPKVYDALFRSLNKHLLRDTD